MVLPYLWRDEPNVASHANDGVTPGRVTIRDLTFMERELHFIVAPRDTLLRPGVSFPRAHIELIRLFLTLVRRVSH